MTPPFITKDISATADISSNGFLDPHDIFKVSSLQLPDLPAHPSLPIDTALPISGGATDEHWRDFGGNHPLGRSGQA